MCLLIHDFIKVEIIILINCVRKRNSFLSFFNENIFLKSFICSAEDMFLGENKYCFEQALINHLVKEQFF